MIGRIFTKPQEDFFARADFVNLLGFKQMNDDVTWGTAIAAEILANEPKTPAAVRVFDAAGKNILTFKCKAASESEICSTPPFVEYMLARAPIFQVTIAERSYGPKVV